MKWIKLIFRALFGNNPTPSPVEIPPVKLPETFPLEDIEPIKDFRFVDSSHHHPEFDVKKYPSKLLINKTSQGTTMVDRTHKERQKLCKENGIIYGGYHFYETKKHWKDQLNHYLKAHGEFAMNPILDFETWEGNQDMSDLRANIENAYQWMIEAEQVTGKRCILYAGYHVLVGLSLPLKFERFIFWVPRYANAIGKLPPPCTEKNLMAWQYTESGAFGGFKGGNDVNLYFGKVNLLGLK
jgi:GH25 family lysozyme M1 (1,4-beta-N-acetylmuramidase)